MLKKLSLLSVFFVLGFSLFIFNSDVFAVNNYYQERISAHSAVLIDVETGQVLYNKNMNVKSFPASTTKILTTIIAIEECDLKETVTVSRKAAYQEGSSIYLKEGEKLSLEELLYGVMLASGNDASIAVAEHVAGSVEEFSKLMNQKAKEMGAKNSHFNNPHGLPDVNHYTTAYDMGMIMRYALKNKDFVKITTTKHKTISWADNDWGRGLRNHNKLLWSYDDITGGKTGYTRAAGRCLVASAKKDGREVAAVVLNDSHDWLDVRNLLDHGLNDFKMIRVINKGDEIYKLDWEDSLEEKLIMRAEKPITLVIPRGKKINVKKKIVLKKKLALPIKKGDIVGYIQFSDEYKQLISVNLVAENDLNYRSIFLRFWHWLTS